MELLCLAEDYTCIFRKAVVTLRWSTHGLGNIRRKPDGPQTGGAKPPIYVDVSSDGFGGYVEGW